MPAFDYGAIQGLAAGILKDFNQGTIQHIATAPGGGAAYERGVIDGTPFTLPGAVANAKFSVNAANQKYQPETLIVVGDIMVTSSVVAGRDPKVGDFLTLDGARHRVIHFVAVPPVGVKIVWIFFVRK